MRIRFEGGGGMAVAFRWHVAVVRTVFNRLNELGSRAG